MAWQHEWTLRPRSVVNDATALAALKSMTSVTAWPAFSQGDSARDGFLISFQISHFQSLFRAHTRRSACQAEGAPPLPDRVVSGVCVAWRFHWETTSGRRHTPCGRKTTMAGPHMGPRHSVRLEIPSFNETAQCSYSFSHPDSRASDIQVRRELRVGLDELPPRFHVVAHQRPERLVHHHGVLDVHLE